MGGGVRGWLMAWKALVNVACLGLLFDGFVWAADCPNGLNRITLQLHWIVQPQFAGYIVADQKGFYAEECLEVTLVPGGSSTTVVDIYEEVVSDRSQFGIAWLGEAVVAREKHARGKELVLLAQIFQRSGYRMVQWKDSGLKTIQDLKDKTVCVWASENTNLRSLCAKYNLTWDEASDRVGRFPPTAYFDITPFLRRNCDSATVMSYNEVPAIYEATDFVTGLPYTKDDLNFIDLEAEGVASMEDDIIASSTWLAKEENADIAVRFLRASFKGWMYARDFPDDALSFFPLISPVYIYQMHEVNKLMWPTSTGIGLTSHGEIQKTIDSLYRTGVISSEVNLSTFYFKHLAEAAHEGLGTTGFVWGPTAHGPGSADPVAAHWKGVEVEFCQVGDSVLVCSLLEKQKHCDPWLDFSDPVIITILVLLIVLIALSLALVGVLIKEKRHPAKPHHEDSESVEQVEDRML